ncbi:MAG: hypothetical protein HN595_06880 [Flavobacteriaceae bacterium]|nr:hypothetical protein [Flavobacteriaceae bacterium]
MIKIFEISFFENYYKLISLLLLIIINSCSPDSTDEVDITPPIQKYTLIVNSSEGGSVNTVGGEYVKGSSVTVTATPNPGFIFSGWTGNSSSVESSITINIEGNLSITANFEPLIDSYELILVTTGGGNVSGAGVYNDGTEVEILATPNDGYRFTGWSDGVSENSRTVTMNSDIALNANFELIIYTLTVVASEGGSVSIENGEYQTGAVVEINASVDENYQFVNWTDSNGNILGEELLISVTINEDTQIQANFSLIPENITFSNPLITPGILSGEFTVDYEISGDFSDIVSKGITLNDSIYTDDISENKINLTIESLEYQEYQVKFFVETSSGQYFSESFALTPDFECASVELTNSDMMLEQEFCTYEYISNIKLAYTGTNILVEYDEDLIPSGINISNENSIVEISGTPYSTDSDNFTFDIKFVSLGECEEIIKTVVLNRSPNSPKINYISGTLSQTITAGEQIEPIEFQYAGSAEGFSFSDLPDGLSYSITGTTYKIEGSLNTAGSYTSTITTVSSSGCSDLSESFSFEVNQPVSSGGGGGSSESNESETTNQQLDCSGVPCRQVPSQDSDWEQYIIDLGYDDVLDGYFDTCRLSEITTIDYRTMTLWEGITSGDEGTLDLSNFCNLEILKIWNYQFKNLNLDNNTKLKHIEFNGSSEAYWIINLDLSNLSDLEVLAAPRLGGGNNEYPLQSLDISSNDKLKTLSLGRDGIYQINTHSSAQTSLSYLEVWGISSSIDVSNYPNLNFLNVQNDNRNICIQVSQEQLDNIDSLNFYKDFRDTFSLNCN